MTMTDINKITKQNSKLDQSFLLRLQFSKLLLIKQFSVSKLA